MPVLELPESPIPANRCDAPGCKADASHYYAESSPEGGIKYAQRCEQHWLPPKPDEPKEEPGA